MLRRLGCLTPSTPNGIVLVQRRGLKNDKKHQHTRLPSKIKRRHVNILPKTKNFNSDLNQYYFRHQMSMEILLAFFIQEKDYHHF